jgi:hypothetical protein
MQMGMVVLVVAAWQTVRMKLLVVLVVDAVFARQAVHAVGEAVRNVLLLLLVLFDDPLVKVRFRRQRVTATPQRLIVHCHQHVLVVGRTLLRRSGRQQVDGPERNGAVLRLIRPVPGVSPRRSAVVRHLLGVDEAESRWSA